MDLLKEGLTSVARKLLVMVFGWMVLPLIAHGWLTSEYGKKIEANLNNWAALLVATVITFCWPMLWGVWNKVVARAKLIIALRTDPTVPASTVEKKVDNMSRGEKLRLATTPGNVPVPNARR